MARKKNVHGGGAQTNLNGLKFEQDTDIKNLLSGFSFFNLVGEEIYFNNKKVALVVEKYGFYNKFLKSLGINWERKLGEEIVQETVTRLRDH